MLYLCISYVCNIIDLYVYEINDFAHILLANIKMGSKKHEKINDHIDFTSIFIPGWRQFNEIELNVGIFQCNWNWDGCQNQKVAIKAK